MALKEDDIKDLGLEIGEEVKPMAVGACSTSCEVCEIPCLNGCEHSCQSVCETSCNFYREQSCCERSCQDDCQKSCERRCQRECQNGECGSCQSCQDCQSTCERACQDAAQKNSAPNMPSSISVPSNVKGGETITIMWGAATDPDGNLSGYILEKKTDSAGFSQIYKGSSRSLSDTIVVG